MNDFAAPRRPLGGLVVLPGLVALNALVYLAFGLAGHGWENANAEMLIRWGSNFGPLSLEGEPWRLATYMALHSGIVHIAVNTFTLVDFGRVCERLFGAWRFLALYLVSGIAGGVASVGWNPMVNSVGASGAISGLVGALFVFTMDRRNGIPVAALKSQAVGLGIFVVYSVVMAASGLPIDHAAHLGGLFGGALAAWILTPWRGPVNALAGLLLMLAALSVVYVGVPRANPADLAARQAAVSFSQDLREFGPREKALLERSKSLVSQWPQAAAMKGLAELASQWDEIHARFTSYRFDPDADQARLHGLLVTYVDLRRRAYRALLDLPRERAPSEFERLSHEIKQTVDEINALESRRAD